MSIAMEKAMENAMDSNKSISSKSILVNINPGINKANANPNIACNISKIIIVSPKNEFLDYLFLQ